MRLSWLERDPIHQKVACSFPSQGAYGRQPIGVSHIDVSLPPHDPPSLSGNSREHICGNISSGEDSKKQNKTKLEKLSFSECREKKSERENASLWIQRGRIQPKTSPSASRNPRKLE